MTRKIILGAVATIHFGIVASLLFVLFLAELAAPLGRDFSASDSVAALMVVVLTFPARDVANLLGPQPDWWIRNLAGLFVVAAASLFWAWVLCRGAPRLRSLWRFTIRQRSVK